MWLLRKYCINKYYSDYILINLERIPKMVYLPSELIPNHFRIRSDCKKKKILH